MRGSFEQLGSAAHVRAEKGQLPREEVAEVQGCLCARRGPASDQTSAVGQRSDASVPGRLAHVDAPDGQAALELFEREPDRFSAVILDQVMPRVGGEEVAARIKALRPSLPIILISGMLSEKKTGPTATEAYRRHGDFVLRKPFSQGDLLAALAQVLPPAA